MKDSIVGVNGELDTDGWHVSELVMEERDHVDLTPFKHVHHGAIWATHKSRMIDWTSEFAFEIVHNQGGERSHREHAGVAFWYTEDNMSTGHVYGSSDHWNGLGVFFRLEDTTKFNQKLLQVEAMVNNGIDDYDSLTVIKDLSEHNELSADSLAKVGSRHISVDAGNKVTFRARITYVNGLLSVEVAPLFQPMYDSSSLMFELKNVLLGANNYFGISVESQRSLNHNILSWIKTHNLRPRVESGAIAAYMEKYTASKSKIFADYDQTMHVTDTSFRHDVINKLQHLIEIVQFLEEIQEMHLFSTSNTVNQKPESGTENSDKKLSMVLDQITQLQAANRQVTGQSFGFGGSWVFEFVAILSMPTIAGCFAFATYVFYFRYIPAVGRYGPERKLV